MLAASKYIMSRKRYIMFCGEFIRTTASGGMMYTLRVHDVYFAWSRKIHKNISLFSEMFLVLPAGIEPTTAP